MTFNASNSDWTPEGEVRKGFCKPDPEGRWVLQPEGLAKVNAIDVDVRFCDGFGMVISTIPHKFNNAT